MLQIWYLLPFLDTLSPLWSQAFDNSDKLTNDLLIFKLIDNVKADCDTSSLSKIVDHNSKCA